MVVHDLTGGGAEQQLNYLAPELVNRGHIVHIYYCIEGPNEINLNGVSLHKTKGNFGNIGIFCEILFLCWRLKPDIIHTWLLKMDILGGIVSLMLKRKWVFREPSSKSAYTFNFKHFIRIVLANFSDAVLCNSKNGCDYWNEKVKSSKIYLVANGLPINAINSIVPDQPIKFLANGPTLLYAGRIIKSKNIDILIRVLEVLNKTKVVNCVICGDGDLRLELQGLVKEIGLEERVCFVGHLSQKKLWGLMKTVNGYISLSAFEGCPNTTLEAMVSQIPVFLSNISAHLEIADNNNSFILNMESIESITFEIEKFLFDIEELNQKSKVAYQRVLKYSIDNMVNQHESIYKMFN